MEYSIGEFSAICGINVFTLRYYEKENLIIPLRKANGRRVYSDDDVSWIQFIVRLKETGMPIKDIQTYAELRAKGEITFQERLELLIQHRTILKKEIAALQDHYDNLNKKIEWYKRAIRKNKNRP